MGSTIEQSKIFVKFFEPEYYNLWSPRGREFFLACRRLLVYRMGHRHAERESNAGKFLSGDTTYPVFLNDKAALSV